MTHQPSFSTFPNSSCKSCSVSSRADQVHACSYHHETHRDSCNVNGYVSWYHNWMLPSHQCWQRAWEWWCLHRCSERNKKFSPSPLADWKSSWKSMQSIGAWHRVFEVTRAWDSLVDDVPQRAGDGWHGMPKVCPNLQSKRLNWDEQNQILIKGK